MSVYHLGIETELASDMLVDMRVSVDHSEQDELSRHIDALGRLSFGEFRLDGGDPSPRIPTS